MTNPGRVAIVTGGGSGIGAAIAQRLAKGGTAVAIVGRRDERLRSTADGITEDGGQVLVLPADMSLAETPSRVVEAVLDAWGRIDVVVNDAAHIRNIRLEELDAEEFDRHYATNLRGPMLLIQAALPALRRSGAASVVNISSSSGSLSIPSQLMYASMKAALEFATRLLAAELAPDRIRVNAIAPGPVDTEIHLLWARDLEEARVALRDAIPLGHIGQPDDIARWVDYLTRADETFVTGAVIPVDGGQTLNGWKSSIGDAAGDAEPSPAGAGDAR
jgi:NAD(P)-dependent dehydrogenase (short-subunit alcohol dehydrogenase family)